MDCEDKLDGSCQVVSDVEPSGTTSRELQYLHLTLWPSKPTRFNSSMWINDH
jgi:hypothetical protein